ncbi:MAG TPA: DUF4382 domain-containing protein [Terriglobia bacterium]|nr:DUF4382 domain-containing protein [Terriglobia bacterium]
MRRRIQVLIAAALVSLLSLVLIHCGSSTNSSVAVNPVMSSVVVFGQDAPVCDVVSFTVTITNASLTPQGGGTPVTVISSGSPVTVDFARLMDFSSVLNLASVNVGTYSQLTLTLSDPQLIVLDVTKSPPVPVTVPSTLSTSTVTINIEPALNVATTGSSGLEIDFKLRKSVQVDSSGQVTGAVNPVLTASPSKGPDLDELKEIDDLAGMVQSVSTTSTNPSFTGSITVETEDLQTFVVNVTSTTNFDDISGLSGLTAGTFIESEVFVDTGGNIIARRVEAEDEEDETERRSAFVGLVTDVTRDTSGNATQFTMFIRGEMPDEGSLAPVKTNLTVNIVPDITNFRITARGTNEGGLSFNAGSLGVGQEVVVHGQIQSGVTPPTVNARGVFLRLQSLVGNFTTLLGAQSDDKTGGFTLVSCAPLFHGQPIPVITFSDTAFANVMGLGELTAAPTIVVKGLLLYEQTGVTLNGIALTPPTLVLEAKQVHQLAD